MVRRLALVALSSAFVVASAGHGAAINFGTSFGPEDVPFPSDPLVSLSLFDPSLGTLTKVTLTRPSNTKLLSAVFSP